MAQNKSVRRAALVWVATVGIIVSSPFAYAGEQPQLSGAANFRDVGGYQTSDGHKIKRRLVYRSGELSGLTPADQQVLESLQIRYEIDLRTDKERAESPTRWGQHAPEVISLSVGHPKTSDVAQTMATNMADLRNQAQGQRFMEQTTARIATQGAAEIGEVLRRLALGDEPALIHCTAGKDRTGVTVAVLMTLLGVPRDQVYVEYMKSNEATEQQFERLKIRSKTGVPSPFPSVPPEVVRSMMGAERSYLEAAFSAIDADYGSFDAYTKNGLKITPDQVRALRAHLLEQ